MLPRRRKRKRTLEEAESQKRKEKSRDSPIEEARIKAQNAAADVITEHVKKRIGRRSPTISGETVQVVDAAGHAVTKETNFRKRVENREYLVDQFKDLGNLTDEDGKFYAPVAERVTAVDGLTSLVPDEFKSNVKSYLTKISGMDTLRDVNEYRNSAGKYVYLPITPAIAGELEKQRQNVLAQNEGIPAFDASLVNGLSPRTHNRSDTLSPSHKAGAPVRTHKFMVQWPATIESQADNLDVAIFVAQNNREGLRIVLPFSKEYFDIRENGGADGTIWVRNPLTGRFIQLGGNVYRKLIENYANVKLWKAHTGHPRFTQEDKTPKMYFNAGEHSPDQYPYGAATTLTPASIVNLYTQGVIFGLGQIMDDIVIDDQGQVRSILGRKGARNNLPKMPDGKTRVRMTKLLNFHNSIDRIPSRVAAGALGGVKNLLHQTAFLESDEKRADARDALSDHIDDGRYTKDTLLDKAGNLYRSGYSLKNLSDDASVKKFDEFKSIYDPVFMTGSDDPENAECYPEASGIGVGGVNFRTYKREVKPTAKYRSKYDSALTGDIFQDTSKRVGRKQYKCMPTPLKYMGTSPPASSKVDKTKWLKHRKVNAQTVNRSRELMEIVAGSDVIGEQAKNLLDNTQRIRASGNPVSKQHLNVATQEYHESPFADTISSDMKSRAKLSFYDAGDGQDLLPSKEYVGLTGDTLQLGGIAQKMEERRARKKYPQLSFDSSEPFIEETSPMMLEEEGSPGELRDVLSIVDLVARYNSLQEIHPGYTLTQLVEALGKQVRPDQKGEDYEIFGKIIQEIGQKSKDQPTGAFLLRETLGDAAPPGILQPTPAQLQNWQNFKQSVTDTLPSNPSRKNIIDLNVGYLRQVVQS